MGPCLAGAASHPSISAHPAHEVPPLLEARTFADYNGCCLYQGIDCPVHISLPLSLVPESLTFAVDNIPLLQWLWVAINPVSPSLASTIEAETHQEGRIVQLLSASTSSSLPFLLKNVNVSDHRQGAWSNARPETKMGQQHSGGQSTNEHELESSLDQNACRSGITRPQETVF